MDNGGSCSRRLSAEEEVPMPRSPRKGKAPVEEPSWSQDGMRELSGVVSPAHSAVSEGPLFSRDSEPSGLRKLAAEALAAVFAAPMCRQQTITYLMDRQPLECKTCGMCFTTDRALVSHSLDHILQKHKYLELKGGGQEQEECISARNAAPLGLPGICSKETADEKDMDDFIPMTTQTPAIESETPDKIKLGSIPGFRSGDFPLYRLARSYPKPHQPSAPISAKRFNYYGESGGYYGRRPETSASRHGVLNQGSTPTSDVNTIATTAGAGTSTGGHTLGSLLAAEGGGGLGHLESHGSSDNSTGGGEAGLGGAAPAQQTSVIGDLEAGHGGATPPQRRPSVNEQEENRTLRNLFIQTFGGLLVASFMANLVLKDAPKHVKIIIFAGQVVIFIVLLAGIRSTLLAHRRLAFWVVSCLAFALLVFSFAAQF